MSCAYCALPIKDTDVYWELQCKKHLSHSTHGTTRCHICTRVEAAAIGSYVPTATPAPAAPQKVVSIPERDARARRLANNAARRTEPLRPYQPSAVTGFFGGVLKIAGRMAEASIPDDESSDPEVLLALKPKLPLTTLVQKHGFDITELINDHEITISDFFKNGYTIGEMCEAFHSRMNPTEGMDVLYYLGMTDQFLSDMPQFSQVPPPFSPTLVHSHAQPLDPHHEGQAWTNGGHAHQSTGVQVRSGPVDHPSDD